MIDQYRYEFLAGMALGSFALIFVFSIIYNEVTSKLKINGLKKSLIKLLVLGTIFIVAGYILKMETLKLSMYLIWILVICIVDFIRYLIKAKKAAPVEVVEVDNNTTPIHIPIPIARSEVTVDEYKEKSVAKSKKSLVSISLIVLIILNYVLVLGLVFYQKGINESLENQVITSSRTIKKLENQIKGQQSRISALETETNNLSIAAVDNDKLSMNINDLNQYSLATSDYGTFLMYMTNAEQHLTGCKLTLMFGNATNATFLNAKFHFVFPGTGTLSSKVRMIKGLNLDNYAEYKYYTHIESKSISDGAWTQMVVYIPDVTMAELKSFYVIPEMSEVRLGY